MSTPRQPQPRAGSGESRAAQPPAPAMALPHGLGLLLLLLLGGPGAAITIPPEYGAHDFLQPPELTEEPPEQLVVFPSDDIVLKCVATGNPPVQYRWSREDQPFVPEEHGGVSVVPGSGTLVINATLAARLQGRFRCFATNALGTAVSPEANVIAENTPQWPKEKVTPVEVEEGDPVVLPCDPPESAVPPKIYWLNSDIVHIAQDERVSMGQDGNLYFSNAMVGDSHPDYICHAHFLGPRTIIQKEPLDLRVAPSNAVRSRRPRLLLPRDPQTTTIALRGGSVVLECIAEGLPTPWVRWRRLNGPLPSRAALENFNKTLRLWGVTESDDGEYECVAENGRGTARGTHSVTVEAAPYWVRRPQSGVFGPGETARLDCEVGGKPRPQIQWSINGVPIDALPGAERRWLRGGALVLPELRPNDSAVLQCEARNRHGRLLANAFLHVVELPVRMLTADEQRYEVVENQTVFLHCRTFGAPAPNVEWLTPTLEPALQDDRSFVFTNGSLRLSAVRGGDGGVYTCMAQNAHSNGSLTALLEVRAPTRISAPPRSATAKKGETVTFHCGATFDPAVTPGELRWLRGGQPLPDDPRYSVAAETLTVSNVDYGDEGTIQCRASTPLDSAEAEAQLRVVGRPGPIRDLQVMEVDEHRVRLSWTPGDDHNSPIEKFVVEEEEGIFSAGRFAERLTVPGGQPWTPPLPLSPYGRFRFRVVAVNAYGRGEHSAPSAPIETPPAAPERNPGGVHGEGNETGNLVITWEPLPPQAWNAPWVRYRVQWRPLEEPGGGGPSGGFPWAESTVDAPPVVVGGLPPFSPFQIRVQAVNGAGKGPEATPGVGHSGEDLPLVYPENVGVELLNSSTVRVRWTLGGGPKELRGRLRGFRVLYWRLGWVGERSRRQAPPDPPQIPQSPAEDPPPFPPVALTVGGDARGALLGGLRPWSRYQLRVLVFNGRGDGPPSEPIAFETPEGVPGPPEELRVERLDDTALSVHWKRPRHLNGVLTGYVLRYQQVEPALGLPQEAPYPSGTLNATLRGLNARSRYRLALRASTRVGSGPALQTVGSTKPEPALPALERVLVSEVGEDFTVLLWSLVQPQEDDVEFEVQFMNKSTDEPWRTSGRANSSLRRYRLEGLRPGTAYRVQFVGRNRSGENVAFWESEVQTNGTVVRSLVGGFATKGWFIGFVSSVVLLLLILLILCFIKRSKGGKYSVKDKEDTQVDSEARPMKDETFGEYRSLESEAEEKGSASGSGAGSGVGSPGRGPCAAGSEDSLAGYGGSGDVQFNEDGSFIGQYRGPGAGPGSSGPASPCAGPPLD